MPYKLKKVNGYKVFHGKKAMSKKKKSKGAAKKHLAALHINVKYRKR
jgi:hypothetical protein